MRARVALQTQSLSELEHLVLRRVAGLGDPFSAEALAWYGEQAGLRAKAPTKSTIQYAVRTLRARLLVESDLQTGRFRVSVKVPKTRRQRGIHRMLESFKPVSVETDGITIRALRGGSGPALLLLHGYPQTRAMWHKVAPVLAQSFTVVAADLRGYGDSDKPQGLPDHTNYAKRRMALDQISLMRSLGFENFSVVSHDRGARG